MGNWNPVTQKPEKSGNYLVALREDNSLEFNHKEPIIAQFGYLKQYPENWSAYDQFMCTHTIFDCDVIWWSELPEVPKNPPFNVWLDWEYMPENPFPKLDGDPLISVEFGDLSVSSIERGMLAHPLSYWHENGQNGDNNFEWPSDGKGGYKPSDDSIIRYMLVAPSDHD